MTITVQSSMSSSVSSTAGSGKTSAAGQAAAGVSFDATLAYQMNGSGSGAATTSTEVAAKLESLLAQYSAETDESLEGLMELLQGLLQELDTMDQALEEDPSLLQELQNWLTQANLLLSGTAPQAQGNADGNEMSPLASHPETIRFAVQDTISQLASMLKNAKGLQLETEYSLNQLIYAFHEILNKGVEKTTSSVQKNLSELVLSSEGNYEFVENNPITVSSTAKQIPQAIIQQSRVLNENFKNHSLNLNGQSGQVVRNDVPTASNLLNNSLVFNQQADISNNGIPKQQGQSEVTVLESLVVEDSEVPDHVNITAGQLALRPGSQIIVGSSVHQVPVMQFAKEMTNFIINKFEFVKNQAFTEARISLNPQHLGQVDIKLTMQNGQLIAQFMTRSTDAKELIDQQMAQLRSALLAQGLQVEKIEVTQSSQPSNANLYQDGRQPGSGQQQPQHRSKEKNRPSDDAVLAANLTEELNDWIAEHQADDETMQGGTFTAKA